MAGSNNSPMFTPPTSRFVEQDSQIVEVPLDKTDWGFRMSQQKMETGLPISHVKNGK
jgi:hypothetical protein